LPICGKPRTLLEGGKRKATLEGKGKFKGIPKFLIYDEEKKLTWNPETSEEENEFYEKKKNIRCDYQRGKKKSLRDCARGPFEVRGRTLGKRRGENQIHIVFWPIEGEKGRLGGKPSETGGKIDVPFC